ncbi:hypothetical protein EON63_05930 [archaeon]|nr:MAG: hypothetical protein EON63_05930 [archaeon]
MCMCSMICLVCECVYIYACMCHTARHTRMYKDVWRGMLFCLLNVCMHCCQLLGVLIWCIRYMLIRRQLEGGHGEHQVQPGSSGIWALVLSIRRVSMV